MLGFKLAASTSTLVLSIPVLGKALALHYTRTAVDRIKPTFRPALLAVDLEGTARYQNGVGDHLVA